MAVLWAHPWEVPGTERSGFIIIIVVVIVICAEESWGVVTDRQEDLLSCPCKKLPFPG